MSALSDKSLKKYYANNPYPHRISIRFAVGPLAVSAGFAVESLDPFSQYPYAPLCNRALSLVPMRCQQLTSRFESRFCLSGIMSTLRRPVLAG